MALKFTILTRANMRQCRAGETLQEHGILFERLENGDGRFRINLRIDRLRVHRVVGLESEGVTREKVEELVEKYRTEAREDRLNLPKGRKTVLSFEEAAGRYITKLEEEGGNNLRVKARQLTQYLIPYFGATGLERVTTSDLERYKKMRKEQAARPATINRELAVISHLFNKAVEWKWILARPAKINRLAEENVRITYLTQEQSARLLEAAREHSTPQLYLFTLIALETSMRKNEILEIQLQNIDLPRLLIYVPRAKRGPREQPITRHLAECLRPHVELAEPDQKWLLASKRSECGHVTYIERAFREAVLRAGLDPREVCRHTLRHTAVTHLIQAGVDLPTVQRISGHKTLQMVVRYAHQNGEHIQAAMDKLERRFHGSVTGEGATEQASGMGTAPTLSAASEKLASPEVAKTTPPPVALNRDSKGRLLMKGKVEMQEQKPSTRRPTTSKKESAQAPKVVVKKQQRVKGKPAELPGLQKKSQAVKRK